MCTWRGSRSSTIAPPRRPPRGGSPCRPSTAKATGAQCHTHPPRLGEGAKFANAGAMSADVGGANSGATPANNVDLVGQPRREFGANLWGASSATSVASSTILGHLGQVWRSADGRARARAWAGKRAGAVRARRRTVKIGPPLFGCWVARLVGSAIGWTDGWTGGGVSRWLVACVGQGDGVVGEQ